MLAGGTLGLSLHVLLCPLPETQPVQSCMQKCCPVLQVNIIPIIAKADTIAKNELHKFKSKIMSELVSNGVQIYQFPTDEETVAEINATMSVCYLGGWLALPCQGFDGCALSCLALKLQFQHRHISLARRLLEAGATLSATFPCVTNTSPPLQVSHPSPVAVFLSQERKRMGGRAPVWSGQRAEVWLSCPKRPLTASWG